MSNPIISITMENSDVIKAELYPEIAPETVANFIDLVEKGFYNGLIFHRVIKGFMIQGGCPKGDGTGNPGYSIKGEFSQNGFENNLLHTEGVLSMARSGHPDSAGSQFFIMTSKSPHLDGAYAGFGKVIEGLENVFKIEGTATPRSEIESGKSPYEIKDAEGNKIVVHQGNADTPIDKMKIEKIEILSK